MNAKTKVQASNESIEKTLLQWKGADGRNAIDHLVEHFECLDERFGSGTFTVTKTLTIDGGALNFWAVPPNASSSKEFILDTEGRLGYG